MAPTFSQIRQLSTETLPYLKHLSINFSTQSFPYNIFNIYNRIFSNGFPHLKSSYLPETEAIMKFDTWTQTLSLRKLKVGKINIFVYKAILSACPNLHFLKFTKHLSKEMPPPCKPHINLRRISIELPLWCSCAPSEINNFLSYVPHLEQFNIHHAVFGGDLNGYLSYDWLSSSIMRYLPSLCCFNYYFEIFYFGLSNRCDNEDILNRIKEDFKKVHTDHYRSRLIIIKRI
jgi:hypothetical protein